MSNDLISDSFADNISKNLVKYNIRLVIASLVLYSVFSVFNLLEWYALFQKADEVPGTGLNFYMFRIRPFVVLITVVIGVYQYNYGIKAQRLILRSLEEKDTALFNSGYSFLNKTGVLNIIGYSIITVSIIVRYFFIN